MFRNITKVFLEAEERLKNTKYLESLFRNRHSLFIRRGLKSLEVKPNDLSKTPPSDPVII